MGRSIRQGIPPVNTPMVDADTLYPNEQWYGWAITVWKKLGGTTSVNEQVVVKKVAGVVTLFDATDLSTPIGTLPNSSDPGGVEQVLSPVASPWVWTAPSSGMLLISHGGVEVARAGGMWRDGGGTGGTLSLRAGDMVRVTWPKPVLIGEGHAPFIGSATVPSVVFFPD